MSTGSGVSAQKLRKGGMGETLLTRSSALEKSLPKIVGPYRGFDEEMQLKRGVHHRAVSTLGRTGFQPVDRQDACPTHRRASKNAKLASLQALGKA